LKAVRELAALAVLLGNRDRSLLKPCRHAHGVENYCYAVEARVIRESLVVLEIDKRGDSGALVSVGKQVVLLKNLVLALFQKVGEAIQDH